MGNTHYIALIVIVSILCIVIWRFYILLKKPNTGSHLNQFEKSQKRFEALVENGLDCVIIISPEGKTMYVSRSVKNILGYTPEEVLDMDIRVMIHPDDIAGAEEALLRTLENPGVPIKGYTSRIRHKDGSWRWIEPVVTNLIHEPSINGIVDNIRDVTDRINAEEELKKTNERFLLATKGSKLGIWDLDLGNDSVIWDEAMYNMYGVSETSFTLNFESWFTLIHEEDQIHFKRNFEKIEEIVSGLDVEFRIVKPDTSIRYIRSLAHIYKDENNKPIRAVGINLDITDSKNYELTLEQIIFDISHLIRKPTTNILGISNLIETDEINKSELKQLAIYMKESAIELDDFTVSLTNTYSNKKMSMKGHSDKGS